MNGDPGLYIWLLPLSFVVAAVGAVTGGQSLVTVPLLMMMGLPPHQAIATNMFAVTFLSLGGTVGFMRSRTLAPPLIGRLGWWLALITLLTSAVGAALTAHISEHAVRLFVPLSMLVFAVMLPFSSPSETQPPAPWRRSLGFVLTAVLGVYGGAYSGGYTTLLTLVCTTLLGISLLRAVALTKFINLFSCAVATLVFGFAGMVQWRLGASMGAVMFVGALVGARVAADVPARALRLFFSVGVVVMAAFLLLR